MEEDMAAVVELPVDPRKRMWWLLWSFLWTPWKRSHPWLVLLEPESLEEVQT
jgi:hypothetical protein